MNSDEQPDNQPLTETNPYASPETDVQEEVIEAATNTVERPTLHSLRGGISALVILTMVVLLVGSAGRPPNEIYVPLVGISGILIFWLGAGRGRLGVRWLVGAVILYQFAETMKGLPYASHTPSLLAACTVLGGSLATLLLDQVLSILFEAPEKEPPTPGAIALCVLGFIAALGISGWLFYEALPAQLEGMFQFGDIYAFVLFGITCAVPGIPLLFHKYGKTEGAYTTLAITAVVTSLISSVMFYWMQQSIGLLFAMPVILVLQVYLAVALYSFDYVLRCFGFSIVATPEARGTSSEK